LGLGVKVIGSVLRVTGRVIIVWFLTVKVRVRVRVLKDIVSVRIMVRICRIRITIRITV